MSTDLEKKQKSELHAKLWAMANNLRSNMDASEFKNYILGLIFYRYLSLKIEQTANEVLANDDLSFKEAYETSEYKDALKDHLLSECGYFLPPSFLFSSLLDLGRVDAFSIDLLKEGLQQLLSSTQDQKSESHFANIFDDMDLENNKLGKGAKERSKLILKIMQDISCIDIALNESKVDILGDAYEYLIGMFAADAGKKGGEFYTPQSVSKILALLVTQGKKELKSVYDPCCGSGSLLLQIAKLARAYHIYGEEKNSTTYNLARMNMLLHGVPSEGFKLYNTDVIEAPGFDLCERFCAIVANPPYSQSWSADKAFLSDERFEPYGVLAPKSYEDYAFVLHMLHFLDEGGSMAVVLPHGVLFRGGAEGKLRRFLVEKGLIKSVIGLPSNVFHGTGITACVVLFEKGREEDDIFFIDASRDYINGKNQNFISDEQISKLVSTHEARKDAPKYAHKASLSEIKENDYNLNIARYIDSFEEEEAVDLKAQFKQLEDIAKAEAVVDAHLASFYKELGL